MMLNVDNNYILRCLCLFITHCSAHRIP